MSHEYRGEIIRILSGSRKKSVALGTIVRMVHNNRASLFAPSLPYDVLYGRVGGYLRRVAKQKDSPIVHGKKWGHYALRGKKKDYPQFF